MHAREEFVSQNSPTPEAEEPAIPVAQGTGTGTPALPEQSAAAEPVAEESTIGTGTSMALGCIAGTVVLIIFGLLFLFLSTLI
jgi:hypothetical protein